MPRNMRIRNRAVILILLPVTIFLWLIGWTLYWTGSRNKHLTPKKAAETNTTISTAILLEDYEEYNANPCSRARKTRMLTQNLNKTQQNHPSD